MQTLLDSIHSEPVNVDTVDKLIRDAAKNWLKTPLDAFVRKVDTLD